jgi:hypothetical protein
MLFGARGQCVCVQKTMSPQLFTPIHVSVCERTHMQAYVGLTPRNNVAWKKVVTGAMTIGVFMCLCMGLAGYLSFRSVSENKEEI